MYVENTTMVVFTNKGIGIVILSEKFICAPFEKMKGHEGKSFLLIQIKT